ncbi:MAG: hypothetical protein US62_C0034G0010 [Candidatus Woesebacteria bacterium GW2011_GWA1_37_8]|uniref:Uncharacterized protein n=1 Tax=Candidatus Woesebacteria bacterium GW2011_GWA1_37_8 TaxID=1618546 RepID=A0A0G0HPD8_9BACT|nr:MAG: hypothetical protein US62_C0034G0010 [Candidatus Woesebacteria bacterium GW2011_GWA1_37_8]
MAKIVGRNASLYVEDSTGACRSISGDLNQVTLSRSAEAPDVTGFGEDMRQRLSCFLNTRLISPLKARPQSLVHWLPELVL